MSIRFPGESTEYRAARDRLLASEIELRRQMERVAAERRALPPGGVVPEDYMFEGSAGAVRLSELFAGKSSLAIYSMMFPRDPHDDRPGDRDGACPSCTALLDQLEGSVTHVEPHISFVVVAKAPYAQLAAFAEKRGWRRLPLVSSAANTFNRDYHAQTAEAHQRPMMNVFSRSSTGDIRHFWGAEMLYAPTDPDQDPRHVSTLEPSWNMFDLTREGRGVDWDEQLDYCCHPR